MLLMDVIGHSEIKPSIVDAIKSLGKLSIADEEQQISHTDWYYPSYLPRQYPNLISHTLSEVCAKIKEHFGYGDNLEVKNIWFQVYEQGDYHDWHIHNSLFSGVYYVSLPNGSSRTTFKTPDEEFSVEANEGQILVFPSAFQHCSKPNQSNEAKVVIAFNINVVF